MLNIKGFPWFGFSSECAKKHSQSSVIITLHYQRTSLNIRWLAPHRFHLLPVDQSYKNLLVSRWTFLMICSTFGPSILLWFYWKPCSWVFGPSNEDMLPRHLRVLKTSKAKKVLPLWQMMKLKESREAIR